jgi:hypothetical protein
MSSAHASDLPFTIAGVLVVVFVLTAMFVLLERRPANAYLTVFLAASLGSPLLFVGQIDVGLAMAVIALACVIPAYRLALSDGGDGSDGRGGDDDTPTDPPPPRSGPDLWSDFEREFWSHVDRTRELVRLIKGRARAVEWPVGAWPVRIGAAGAVAL